MELILLSLHFSKFTEGLGVGLIIGLLVGVAWEEAFEMVTGAWRDRHHKGNREEGYMNLRGNWLAVLLGITSVMMMVIGAFQIYAYVRQSNFITCQAEYNQQSAVARDARIGVTDAETDLLFKALADNITAAEKIREVPADKQEALANKLQKKLLREFNAAVRAHDDRIASAKAHPYPPNPEKTCGEY